MSVPAVPAHIWAFPGDAVLEALGVDRLQGLSPAEVQRRLHRYGPNRLRERRRRNAWWMLWDQLSSPIVALSFDERLEATAIAAVLVINTAIGFWTERRAVRSMEALRELGRVHATVRRVGVTRVVPAEELVPGDIVLLDAGDVLTADLRLVLTSRLQVDQAILTGESLPIDKDVAECPAHAVVSEQHSMAFKGTAVTRGTAEGVVVATGMETELGKISKLVGEAEPEVTPLEARLDRLGHRLILLTLATAALVALASVLGGRSIYLSIELGLALAVAAVPEGLPIVATVALARGMWRMAKRNALVEQLSAVETLGSTTILLADKTGTLTENRMVVAELALADGSAVTFDPNADEGIFRGDEGPIELSNRPLLTAALRTAALCNNAELSTDGSEARQGDPTEVALLIAARSAGLGRESLLETSPEIREVAFDSDARRMATLHQIEDGVMAAVKGAPESILATCTRSAVGEGPARPLDPASREAFLDRADEMASQGQRVLALATRTLGDPDHFAYEDMTFLGLVGLLDPPRADAQEAIRACRAAGIRVVMVTGDHGGTAWRVALATGLASSAEERPASLVDARTSPRLDDLPDDEAQRIVGATVIARATPRQKLELISLFQRHGAVVAMTGDGVNDAPALRKADIGVAMGLRGTQVAREAADMVLQDDRLETIVAAVAQGRAIFANIRKFAVYLLSCNVSEVLAVAVGSLAQGPLPLLPLQILFLNLVTDVFPALALGVGEGSTSLMREPPRSSREALISRRHWLRILGMGTVIASAVLVALACATTMLGKSMQQATTISFLTLALAQLWHVFSMRASTSNRWRNEITRNPWIWAALALCLVLIGLAVRYPPLATVLSMTDPGRDGFGLALVMSLVPLVAGQLGLARRAKKESAGETQRA
ncbi:MAG: cation-transporting P-type ATPase [Deltaproteobacteria bacterium]|nr:cation-transporting P-type ATPase [Deltaproteobacteria bacterium]MBW2444772.1 cation-transporting P-type ATPase [Deltaproteobacteria bacterium]